MTVIVLSLLIGIVAGLRAMTAPAAAAFGARFGALAVAGTPMAFMGYAWTAWILGLAALSEFVTDQLPSTPSRKVPVQFTARILTGALSGATVAAPSASVVTGVVAGIIGAIIGTLGGAALRVRLAAAFGNDRPAAILEDLIAVGAAILIVTAPSILA
jgi:uncharacterized membrane protein